MSPAKREPAPVQAGTPDELIAAADAEVIAADEAVAQLEAAAADGDDSVTPEALTQARTRAEWARFRRTAAEKKAAALAAELAAAEYARLHAAHYEAATADVRPQVDALLAQARPLLAEAHRLIVARNAAIFALAGHLQAHPREDAPETFYDGHLPQSSWVAGEDGRRHGFINGAALLRGALDEVVRSL